MPRGTKKREGKYQQIHLLLPIGIVEQLDEAAPENRTAFIIRAIEEVLKKEGNFDQFPADSGNGLKIS